MDININLEVGRNIKRLREEKKLTLDGAAGVTGVSRSMLAQIEKEDVNPTISVLWKIANGYKVSFSSLIETSMEEMTVVREQDILPIREDGGGYVNYPIFPFDDRKMFETYRIVIEPEGKLCAQPHLAGTEEFITVFRGNVGIEANGRRWELSEGDSIRFKADVPHGYWNMGDSQAQLSMIIFYGRQK